MTDLCPRATIRIGKRRLDVHVADSPVQWRRGLVNHTDTGAAGMLFAMPHRSRFSFHIGPLTMPVLLAFFDADRQLVDIGYLDQAHPIKKPAVPYSYALELIGDYARLPLAGIVLRDIADGLDLS
jgi:uncharacterized membrane protein (UPF0127 family)